MFIIISILYLFYIIYEILKYKINCSLYLTMNKIINYCKINIFNYFTQYLNLEYIFTTHKQVV